jgi:hypothetical protein
VRRVTLGWLAAVVLAGCGGHSTASHGTTTAVVPKPGPGTVLYQGGSWAVVVDGLHATAQHLVGGSWQPDESGRVHVTILGPHKTAPARPQVAAELSSRSPLVESGLWVDGVELLEKGGGLTPTRGTIYGTTAGPLPSGRHVAVAYGRTSTHGAAIAWVFRVP